MPLVVYHVTSSLNRASIAEHGLDWHQVPAEQGIAGSNSHEQDGVFLARDLDEVDWFVSMGRRRVERDVRRDLGIDVWEVTLEHDLDSYFEDPLSDLPYYVIDGYLCWAQPIPAARLRLIKQDL
jgi:hypothetical protein